MYLRINISCITSAEKEKEENGHVIDMTRMAFETLESVENLQIQLIGQQKQMRELKAENDRLKSEYRYQQSKIESLESRLSKLEILLKATSNK